MVDGRQWEGGWVVGVVVAQYPVTITDLIRGS
jgi:hypothetical protein